MTPRERRDFPWIIAGFVIVIGVVIVAILASLR
jgi:hypothetical protein